MSKAFTLAVALGRFGEGLWQRVGREPSSNAFNSVVDLELEKGKPRNPFVNASAIVVTDEIMAGRAPREALAEILWLVRTAAGDNDIFIDESLAHSEKGRSISGWFESGGQKVSLTDWIVPVLVGGLRVRGGNAGPSCTSFALKRLEGYDGAGQLVARQCRLPASSQCSGLHAVETVITRVLVDGKRLVCLHSEVQQASADHPDCHDRAVFSVLLSQSGSAKGNYQ